MNSKSVSELPFISKMLDKAVANQLFDYLDQGSSTFFRPRTTKLMERWSRDPLIYTLPFKSLESIRNFLIFHKKSTFFFNED